MVARAAVPRQLAQAPLRTVRPRDAAGVYRQPRAEFARLVDAGALLRLTDGYYTVVPDDQGSGWRPTLEEAAAGVAAAIYGPQHAILMGASAAHHHGAIPRALAVAVLAVPRQHRALALPGAGGGTVHFVKRDTDRLDAGLEELGDLGQGLVTTPEQTALDLSRPLRHHIDDQQREEAISNLLDRCDPDVLADLAAQQRGQRALLRLRRWTR